MILQFVGGCRMTNNTRGETFFRTRTTGRYPRADKMLKGKWRYIKFALTVVGLTSPRVRPTPLALSTSGMHNCASEPKEDNEERKEEKQKGEGGADDN